MPLFLFAILLTAAAVATPAVAGERLQVGGTARTYEIAGAQPGTPKPLVLALHGNLGTGVQFDRQAGWSAAARRHGFVVALPDGLNNAWADGRDNAERKGKLPPAGTDDVGFLVALAQHLVRTSVADPKRLYVAGLSNGGMMTMRLVCEWPELFAAGAAMIASLTTSSASLCRKGPVPMLLMNGTEDRLVPYERSGVYLGTDATAAVFRRLNGCADEARREALLDHDSHDSSTVSRITYACPAGADVVVLRVEGGGHQMPSRALEGRLEFLLGRRNRDLEGSDAIWDFLSRFRR